MSVFRAPSINIYTHDVPRLVAFYEGLGFRETFRTPKVGEPAHIELMLGGFTLGVAAVKAAASDHRLSPNLEGHSVEVVLWTDDVDLAHSRLTGSGSPSLSPPHDFLSNLRAAWVSDPDGNPIQLVQRRAASHL